MYMKWVHSSFDNLISTLQSLNMNKQVDAAQIQLSHWLRDNPKLDTPLSLAILDEEAQSFSDFMGDFNVWEKKAKKLINFAREEKREKEKQNVS